MADTPPIENPASFEGLPSSRNKYYLILEA